MSRTLYTSDLHFGHVNIMLYAPQRFEYLGVDAPDSLIQRCFDFCAALAAGEEPTDKPEVAQYTGAMNEGLVDLWNSQVAPDDTVWIVGDVAMGRVQETIQYVSRLNGTKHLVLGNHDRPHPIATKNEEKRQAWIAEYEQVGFDSMIFQTHLDFDGIEAEVSHFPYYGDHSMSRYNAADIEQYVLKDDGHPLVHGHVHDMWQTRDHMYNLGIDAWNGVFQTAEAIGAYFRSQGYSA